MGNLWFSASKHHFVCQCLLWSPGEGVGSLIFPFPLPLSEVLYEQREMILVSLCLFLIELALWAVV